MPPRAWADIHNDVQAKQEFLHICICIIKQANGKYF